MKNLSLNYYQVAQFIFSVYCAKEALKVIKEIDPDYVVVARELINSMENYIENPNKENKADIKVKQSDFKYIVTNKIFKKVSYSASIVISYAADVFYNPSLANIEYLQDEYNKLNTLLVKYAYFPLKDISILKAKADKEAIKYVKPNNILDFFDRN
jgi:Icc-related predicted phosphoesterase